MYIFQRKMRGLGNTCSIVFGENLKIIVQGHLWLNKIPWDFNAF